MAISPEISERLAQDASALRPVGDAHAASVIRLAEATGLAVRLKMIKAPIDAEPQLGRLDYGGSPHITVFRRAEHEFERELSPSNEGILTQRERFTIAHEIGHWLAYKNYNILPASRRSEYWKDEAQINVFAGSLLLPEWQVAAWMRENVTDRPMHIQRAAEWATRANVSMRVLCARIQAFLPEIMFIFMRPIESDHRLFPHLRVVFSAGPPDAYKPEAQTILRSERLIKILRSLPVGDGILRRYLLGKDPQKEQNFYMTWMRSDYGKSPASDEINVEYRTSWSRADAMRVRQDEGGTLL